MIEENMLTVTIDGLAARVPEGTYVLQAARKLGIEIPALCYHEALPMYAACRLCICEMSIEKRGRTYNWITASCAYPVEDGLVVQTDTPKVRRERKLILELLLSRAPDAPVLNELAERYGADKNRFTAADRGESNCILCGLCVRVCQDMMKTGGIGTAFRGIHKKVVTPFALAGEICTGCVACAYVCPTGAIQVVESDCHRTIENWECDLEMQRCVDCGRAFAPVKYLAELAAKVPIRHDILEQCPECRRKRLASGESESRVE